MPFAKVVIFAGMGFVTLGLASLLALSPQDKAVDLMVSIASSTEEAFAETVMISVTVKNAGAEAAPEVLCELLVRNARPPRQLLKKLEKKIRPLKPGESFVFSSPVKPGLGSYEVCATIDPKNAIAEADESNNKACFTLVGK